MENGSRFPVIVTVMILVLWHGTREEPANFSLAEKKSHSPRLEQITGRNAHWAD